MSPNRPIAQSFNQILSPSPLLPFSPSPLLPFSPSPLLLFSLSFSFLLLLSSCNWVDPKGSMVVLTLNARYDNPADAPNDWESRKPIIINTILDKSADIIGFQEVLKSQLDDLDSLLPWYDYFGVGRQDGEGQGEHCPVFYKMNRFEALDWGTLWLSETPGDTGSTGWDAALPRILTWVKFRDLHLQRDGQFFEFYFLNTHFDHLGDTARENSARLINDFINQETQGLDVVLTGDFNCLPGDAPYQVMTSNQPLSDVMKICSPGSGNNGEPTYNGFGHSSERKRIDFIFVSPGWIVLSCETPAIIRNDIYISDHFPVVSRIKTSSY